MARIHPLKAQHTIKVDVHGEERHISYLIAGIKIGLKLAGLWRQINRIQVEAIAELGKKLDETFLNGGRWDV